MSLYNRGMKHKRMEELYAKIEAEVDYIDVKPFSHNIVGLVLRQIADEFGQDHANDAIEHFQLELLGWSKVEPQLKN